MFKNWCALITQKYSLIRLLRQDSTSASETDQFMPEIPCEPKSVIANYILPGGRTIQFELRWFRRPLLCV